ncbi:hypothetical protein V1477_015346 [Vespula maculifrons]|uniref:Uncharacterized protein n=1 Tax=Vespula maculifrons TaxID=7453 RepID=A0ABD2BGE3_VESMC
MTFKCKSTPGFGLHPRNVKFEGKGVLETFGTKSLEWMDGWMVGWSVGWMDGWSDGWMDGWILVRVHYGENLTMKMSS